jgi:hypothetical protein
MAKVAAPLLLVGLCGFTFLGVDAAGADGPRFGGWGPRFGGPYFGGPRYDGPRYDGPRYYDVEPDPVGPPPDEPFPGPEPGLDAGVNPGPPGPPGLSGPRLCYSPAQTRERVVAEHLREPFALMRKASGLTHAEALSGRLCRWGEVDIYDITLLRADGRVIHLFLNAATGAVVGGVNAR